MNHIESIITNLDLAKGDLCKSDWSLVFSDRVASTLKPEFNLYAVFRINETPFILFFNNPTPSVEKDLHKWIWNFNQSAVAVIVKDETVSIYNAFSINSQTKFLEILDSSEMLEKNFNYLQLVTGETWQTYKGKFAYKNRVDYRLLDDLEAVRLVLVEKLIKKSLTNQQSYRLANSLIGRLLFIRYLIDRSVKFNFENFTEGYLTAQDLNQILADRAQTLRLFLHLRKYNGDLFPLVIKTGSRDGDFDEHDFIDSDLLGCFITLFEGGEIGGQLSLFPLYDFSVLPVEFISNVYEMFIGSDKQREQGAYYTPKFLVDYILNKTVTSYFDDNPTVAHCRVLDPACGSGIFLVETLRKIVGRYQKLNLNYATDTPQYQEDLRQLVWNNIYGIDKDDNAIDIAIFSLYITLLDYQSPADIEVFKLPKLRDKNFFHADFFKDEANYNSVLKNIDFDFIIGNPPWGTTEESEVYMDYCKRREKREKSVIKISNKEAAQAFMVRASDFSTAQTQIAFVVTSKVLYNLQAKEFRTYWLNHFLIDEILELSSVRKEVFDKISSKTSEQRATAPAAVLFYRWANGQDTKAQTVNHIGIKPNLFFKLFKVFVIEKYDIKKVSQYLFLEYDWLFKLLVYGNVLDFQLMRKLLRGWKNVNDLIKERNLIFGKGIALGNRAAFVHQKLIGLPYLDTRKKWLKKYYLHIDTTHKWLETRAERPRIVDLFIPPFLLAKKGLEPNFSSVSAFCNKELVFNDSITAIKGTDNDIDSLRTLSGLFNSNISSYFLLMKGSSVGIEREQAHNKDEKFTMPYIFSEKILENVKALENFKQAEYANVGLFNQSEVNEKSLTDKLNQSIYEAFKLSSEERSLINYAQNVSISLLRDREKSPAILKLSQQDTRLVDYAQVFVNHFKSRFSNHFGVEIFRTDYCIAMRFYQTNEPIVDTIQFGEKSMNDLYTWFYQLGIQQVMDRLFIQKDVRGFEKNAFYIIKPNEVKCWHEAVAYLDASEFSQVIENL